MHTPTDVNLQRFLMLYTPHRTAPVPASPPPQLRKKARAEVAADPPWPVPWPGVRRLTVPAPWLRNNAVNFVTVLAVVWDAEGREEWQEMNELYGWTMFLSVQMCHSFAFASFEVKVVRCRNKMLVRFQTHFWFHQIFQRLQETKFRTNIISCKKKERKDNRCELNLVL